LPGNFDSHWGGLLRIDPGRKWEAESKTLGTGETAEAEYESSSVELKSEELTIQCSAAAGQGTITGGTPGTDETTLDLAKCSDVGRPSCTVVTPIAISNAKSSLDTLNEIKEEFGDKLEAISSTIEIVGSECASAGSYTLEGNVVGRANNSAEELEFTKPAQEGSTLTLGGHVATLVGSLKQTVSEPVEIAEETTKEEKEKEEKEEKERHFTSTSKGGTLKAGADIIACAKDTSTGELTSTMLFGAVVIHFLECTSTSNGSTFCAIRSTNTSSEGLILTATLHAIVGLSLPNREAGLLLLPASGKTWETLAANACTPETKVTGTVAGLVTPTGKAETTSKVVFSTASGKQQIKDLDTLAGLIEPQLTAFSESATEETTEEVTWGKAIELP
jgi:hypothetical protein